MSKIKKLMIAAFCAFTGLLARAEVTVIDTQVADDTLKSLTDAMKEWFTDAWPVILGLCGILLIPWLIKVAIRVVKSLTSAFG